MSEIKKDKNPIQRNPSNPRNPKKRMKDFDKNIPDDQDEADVLIQEVLELEKQLKEEVKPYLAPVRKPKKSNIMETDDGKALMDEIDRLGKVLDDLSKKDKPMEPKKLVGECGSKKSYERKISVKEYLGKNKTFQHQVSPFKEARKYVKDPSEAPEGANVQRGARGGY